MKNLKLFILSVLFFLGTTVIVFSIEDDNLSIDEQTETAVSAIENEDVTIIEEDAVITEGDTVIDHSEEESTQVSEAVDSYEGGIIKDVKIQNHSNTEDTITFILDKPSIAEVKVLNLPYRLFLDIPMPYKWDVPEENLAKIPLSVANGFRYGTPTEGIFRVTVDLTRSSYLKRAYVKELNLDTQQAGAELGYEFNVDISASSKNGASILSSANSIVFSNDKSILKEITSISNDKEALDKKSSRGNALEVKIKNYLESVTYKKPQISDLSRRLKVFIDPGHGGKDPGATSEDKSIQEKDLVLSISKELKSQLDNNKEITAILSREDDYYIPLNDRVLWAQYLGADVFVSIHADNATSKDTAGLSVYTLSESASDIQTQILANSENQSDLIAGIDLNNDDTGVNNILLSLSQRSKSNESIALAKSIVDQASKTTKVMQNPIRSAGFAVLKLPNTPSVLVELGFLSNKEDVADFKRKSYTTKIAITLASGIEYYLWKKGDLKNFPVEIVSKLNSYVDEDIANAIEGVSDEQSKIQGQEELQGQEQNKDK